MRAPRSALSGKEYSGDCFGFAKEPRPRPLKRRRISRDSVDHSGSADTSDSDGSGLHGSRRTLDVSIISSVPSRIHRSASEIPTPILTPEDLAELPSILHPRNATTKATTATSFSSLELSPWLLQTLRTLSITNPTPIQLHTIPSVLSGSDILASSPTGTGKTLAFALPILQAWARDPFGIFALILTPTRELATQIYEQFAALGATQDLKVILVTGGSEMRPQALALGRRPHVVVATPGRLSDHVQQSGEDTVQGLRRCKVLVLDEADRLLDKNARMLEDVGTCLSVLPDRAERQTLLYTATMTDEVRALKEMKRKKDREILLVDLTNENRGGRKSTEQETQLEAPVKQNVIPASLEQTYLLAPSPQKAAYLHVVLNHLSSQTPVSSASGNQMIVFTNRTSTAQSLNITLSLLGHPVTALHSLLAQRERTKNLADFRARKAKILVSTDVGSRGLDIDGVGTVINFDVPRDPADYVHRIGRTARAGKSGTSITFVGARDVSLVQAIEEMVREQMQEWKNKGKELVNVETRVVKDGAKVLKEVGVARMEALRMLGGSRDEHGRMRKIKKKR